MYNGYRFCKKRGENVYNPVSINLNLAKCSDEFSDHPCGTYIFELKVDRPPALAMSQAECKGYAAPFVAAGKPIWLVGLSFERETRKFLAGAAERYGE